MSKIQIPKPAIDYFRPPDHLQLPETDGSFAQSFHEHPQSMLLTSSIWPMLCERHPVNQFCIGRDSGIYWRWTEDPLEGCKAPDWFYVPGVPPLLDGVVRRSFVLWIEGRAPLIAIEFVSGDGKEERDPTPQTGKFWVYEQGIRIPFYAVYDVNSASVDVYHLVDARYRPLQANARGHFEIEPMGVELGIWRGMFLNLELPWLRWWDLQGKLLTTGDERAVVETQRADQEKWRAQDENRRVAADRAQRLAEKLRSLGVNPDEV